MLKYAIFVVIAIVAVGEYSSHRINLRVQHMAGNYLAVQSR